LEAMRLQDSGINSDGPTAIGAGLPDDAQARAFLQQNPTYMVNGQSVNIFQPAAPDDSSKNAYALYNYLYQNPDAANAFYGAQQYGLSQHGISDTPEMLNQGLAHWANQDVLSTYAAGDAISAANRQANQFVGQLVMTGVTAGLPGGVPFLTAANATREGGTVGTILGYMLTSRVGAGALAGGVNATSQLILDGSVRWTNVGVAATGGALGVGGGAWMECCSWCFRRICSDGA